MKTDAPPQPFSPSERLALFLRKHGRNFITRSKRGLRQIPAALHQRHQNIYYPVIMRYIWGRYPWLMMIIAVVVIIAISYAAQWGYGYSIQWMNPRNLQWPYIVMGTFVSFFPLALVACLLGWRIHSLLASRYYREHIAMVPQSSLPVFQTICLQILWLDILFFLTLFIQSAIAWFNISPSIQADYTFFHALFGLAPNTNIFIAINISIVNKCHDFLRIYFFLLLLVYLFICIKDLARAVLLAFITSVIFICLLSFITQAYFWLSRFIQTIFLDPYDSELFLLIPYYHYVQAFTWQIMQGLVFLLLTGFILDVARRRICGDQPPTEVQ